MPPVGVRVLEAQEIDCVFIQDLMLKLKTYKYILNTDQVMDPIFYNYRKFSLSLDVEEMQKAKEFLSAKRVLNPLWGQKLERTNPVREIKSFEIYKEKSDLIFL